MTREAVRATDEPLRDEPIPRQARGMACVGYAVWIVWCDGVRTEAQVVGQSLREARATVPEELLKYGMAVTRRTRIRLEYLCVEG